MAAETGFTIDGNLYEVPGLETLTMDEAQVLYDYSGLTLDQFVPLEDDDYNQEEDPKFKNPGLLRALMHIAFQRGNPKMSPEKVRALIGAANVISALEGLVEEDEADPPASTTEPDESSPTNSVDSNESSGTPSETDTGGQVVPLAPTTGGRLPPSESAWPISAP